MFSGAGGAPTVRAPFYKSNNPHQLFEPFDVVTLLSDNAQFALVGDEGNSGDVLESYEPLNPSSSRLSGFGAVSYQFGIGKNLVTLEDYAEFLNSVALEEDSNQLYRSEMDTDHQTSGIHRSDSA
ncbi:MAG: hypothetical protein EBZ49_12965, partial [Proteobacteria bacterium]|nr:hypothetical protein [Pseudomonadota bacterium]